MTWAKCFLVATVAMVLVAFGTRSWSHGGGLDAQGGHHDRKNGGYHFHRGALTGEAFSSKSAATAALSGSVSSSVNGITNAGKGNDDIAVLVALLEAKGILEPGEFDEALRVAREK